MAGLQADLAGAQLTGHAIEEMARRGLSEDQVRRVLSAPEQWREVRPGRIVCQSRDERNGRLYLVRVFVDIDRTPPEVVTAYRTSKVEKYWGAP